MPLVTFEPEDEAARLALACDWLSDSAPALSSKSLLSRGQRITFLVLLGVAVLSAIVFPLGTGVVAVALVTALYLFIVLHRVYITVDSLRHPHRITISDEAALAVPDDELPVYSILVPIYREARVVPQLVANLRALDYPREKLDLKILVEADDPETIDAVLAWAGEDFEVVIVPDGGPRTKPKALNFAATMATGEYLTIYDAEDRPEPLQLRRAVLAFRQAPPEVACVQAQLEYWNTEQNLVTRWFGTEYLMWFRLLLPGLSASEAPVPLGGTSNHIRRQLLVDLGFWDPYNVTEDADLGVRLHRSGYRSAVLASVTWEEANSDFVNWAKQRSRWYKGYLQTWLVHMRHPSVLLDELGWRGFFEFNAFVGGTPLLAFLNPVFWILTLVWFGGHIDFIKQLFPTAVYYPALFCFVVGNAAIAYLCIVGARISERASLVRAACLVPLYWVMMAIAAVKAFWQLLFSRSFWEKTTHGLAPHGSAVYEPPLAAGEVPRRLAVPIGPVGPPPLTVAMNPGPARANRGPARWLRGLAQPLQLLGLMLLVFALYVVVLGGIGRSSSASQSDAVGVPLTHAPQVGATLARLTIPRAGIDQLVVEGAGAGQTDRALGHLRETALPGDAGNAVIVGHRIAAGGRLGKLDKVKVGDEIRLEVGSGSARYRVDQVRSADRTALGLRSSGSAELSIVSGAKGFDPERVLLVHAVAQTMDGVRFTGPGRPVAPKPVVPGGDGGSVFTALVWLAAALIAARVGTSLGRRWGRVTGLLVVAPAVLLALLEVCVAGSHALPATF